MQAKQSESAHHIYYNHLLCRVYNLEPDRIKRQQRTWSPDGTTELEDPDIGVPELIGGATGGRFDMESELGGKNGSCRYNRQTPRARVLNVALWVGCYPVDHDQIAVFAWMNGSERPAARKL